MKFKAALVALTLATAAPATAATVVSVGALDGNIFTGGVETDVTLVAGEAFTVTADMGDTWSLGAPPRTFRADGTEVSGAVYGTFSALGFTFNYGTLVGKIGSGAFFAIGTNFAGTANASGELVLFNWDSEYSDNSGEITATISKVPLPAGAALMIGGLALLGGAAGAKRRKA